MTNILIVTTSHDRFGDDHPLPTGIWLEEFAVPYMEFFNSGMAMTIASPQGGAIPIDPCSNPTPEQAKAWQMAIEAGKHTVKLSEVVATEFDAIFLPGGHGPMFDLPDNLDLQRLLRELYEADKLIAAVCHCPAGLIGIILADGTPLVKGKILTAYTYAEEAAAKLDQSVPLFWNTAYANWVPISLTMPIKRIMWNMVGNKGNSLPDKIPISAPALHGRSSPPWSINCHLFLPIHQRRSPRSDDRVFPTQHLSSKHCSCC